MPPRVLTISLLLVVFLLCLLEQLGGHVDANLAFKRTVLLSSTKQSHPGALAVDGDETTWAETERGKRDWLQIDFGGIVPVSVIEILPKPGSTLQNFWIFGTKGYTDRDDIGALLSTASFALFDPIDSSPDPFGDEQERMFGKIGAEEDVPGFPSRKGTPWLRYFVSFTARYIRIQANGSLPLEIAEVRVYPTTCGVKYRRVGQVARLSNRFHGVGGTAAIVDDCTIVLSKFNFDADLSLETRIVVGPLGSFNTGVSVSTNLVKGGPYKSDMLVLKDLNFEELLATMRAVNADKGGGGGEDELPADDNKGGAVADTSDAVQCISVFCTQAWIDFGSGCFQKPPPDWTWD